MNNYVNPGIIKQINGAALSGATKQGVSVSGNFMKVLQDQMQGWLSSLGDGQITEGEVAFIDSLGSGSVTLEGLSEMENEGEVLYDGSAAYLFLSVKMNDINNLVSWMFKFMSSKNELYDKASSMLTG